MNWINDFNRLVAMAAGFPASKRKFSRPAHSIVASYLEDGNYPRGADGRPQLDVLVPIACMDRTIPAGVREEVIKVAQYLVDGLTGKLAASKGQ